MTHDQEPKRVLISRNVLRSLLAIAQDGVTSAEFFASHRDENAQRSIRRMKARIARGWEAVHSETIEGERDA